MLSNALVVFTVLAAVAVAIALLRRRQPKTPVAVVEPLVQPPIPVIVPTPVPVEVTQPVVFSAPPPAPIVRSKRKPLPISAAPKDSSPCGGRGLFTDFILSALFTGSRTSAELVTLAQEQVPELCSDPTPCEHSDEFCWQHSLRWDMQPLRVQGFITHSGAKPFKPAVWNLTAEGIAHINSLDNMLKTKGATASE